MHCRAMDKGAEFIANKVRAWIGAPSWQSCCAIGLPGNGRGQNSHYCARISTMHANRCRGVDVSGLLGLSWLDVLDGGLVLPGPLSQRFADAFGAIVDPDRARFSPPFYDPVEAPYDRLGRKREVHLDPQSFAVEVIQHVQ
jgi:hypothetical protein